MTIYDMKKCNLGATIYQQLLLISFFVLTFREIIEDGTEPLGKLENLA